MRCFFVDTGQIEGSRASLEGAEARHLKNVLRLKPGDRVRLCDGTGMEHEARIELMAPGRVVLAVIDSRPAPGRPSIRLDVAQGFLKDKKMDRLVRQLSELGAARWQPFVSGRAVARPEGGRVDARTERWQRIAVEALKQCRRGDLMAVGDILTFEQVLALRPAYDLGVIFWEQAARPLSTAAAAGLRAAPATVLALIGPEGGFAADEVGAAEAAGFVSAGLGPRILRAETAAVAACTVIQHLFGDLGPGQKELDKNQGLA